MEWLADVLKIRPGEGRIVALLAGMIAVTSAGTGMGAASVNALFFSRFGVQYLPYLYIALGLVTFLNLMAVAALLGRFPREQVYAYLPLALIAVLVVFRLALALNLRWFYPVLFVGKEVVISLQSVLMWGLAGNFFEARQAKRLFPLLVSGSIAGISLGSIATPLLVGVLGSENILLAWGVTLVVGYMLIRWMPGYERARTKGAKAAPSLKARRPRKAGESSFGEEVRRGYQYVRQSSLMRWLALSSVLFSVLWFSLLLPFSRAAAAQYPDADALAGFLGISVYHVALNFGERTVESGAAAVLIALSPGFHAFHCRVAGSYRLTCPDSHSLIHKRPLLSLHTRRAPWLGVGGWITVAAPVRVSICARWLPASDT